MIKYSQETTWKKDTLRTSLPVTEFVSRADSNDPDDVEPYNSDADASDETDD